MSAASEHFPHLGFGLGLRIPHYPHIFEHWPKVDWFEIISENFMDTDGRPKRNLARIRERYPIVMHGVALSIGTVDPLHSEYLQKLKKLIEFARPAWISDHLCWTGIAHRNSHDLLPVPYTEEALKHIVSRIKQVQDYLERPIALENPSTYLEFKTSYIPEAEFIAAMAKESGCHLLLDVNNIYVTCYNHRLDPKAYIDALPLEKVVQIHLSGHSNMGTHIIDTHDDHVIDKVWALYRYVIHKAGCTINTMVEWDDNLPEFAVLYNELGKAKAAAKDAQHYHPLPELVEVQTPYTANRITPLGEAQSRMQEAVLSGDDFADKPEEWIRAKKDFSASDQLAIYTSGYRYRLYDVTAEDYPILQHYLGDEKFHSLLNDFMGRVRSDHFNIARYSAKLPNFLADHLPEDKFAYELALLENALSQLNDSPETVPLEPQHLVGITPESFMEIRLFPRKALQLFAFDYAVNDYYRAVQDGESPEPEYRNSFIAVFRHDDTVWRMDLEESEYRLLFQLFEGLPIGKALESQSNLSEEVLGGWFGRWMQNGLLAYEE